MDAVAVLFDDDYAGKNVAIGHPTKDATYGNVLANCIIFKNQ